MPKKPDPLRGLAQSIDAEEAAVERRFNDAERFTAAPQTSARRPKPRRPRKSTKKGAVRDTFSFPREDHALIGELQRRCYAAGFAASKSELVRAGLRALDAMPDAAFGETMAQLEKLKPGPARKSES